MVMAGIILVNKLDEEGQNALHYATKSKDPEVVQYLID